MLQRRGTEPVALAAAAWCSPGGGMLGGDKGLQHLLAITAQTPQVLRGLIAILWTESCDVLSNEPPSVIVPVQWACTQHA